MAIHKYPHRENPFLDPDCPECRERPLAALDDANLFSCLGLDRHTLELVTDPANLGRDDINPEIAQGLVVLLRDVILEANALQVYYAKQRLDRILAERRRREEGR